MYVEAILIPSLNLKVTEAGIPDCFNRYNHMKTNISWAQNDDGLRGPVGQLLLGADCIESSLTTRHTLTVDFIQTGYTRMTWIRTRTLTGLRKLTYYDYIQTKVRR